MWRIVLLILMVALALLIPFVPAIAQVAPTAPESPGLKDWLLLIFGWDWTNVILVAFALYAFALLVYWQLNRNDGFDMRAMLARQNPDGSWTVEPGRVFQSGAFGVTTWLVIFVTTHDKMTETYLFVYVALWAGSRAINQLIASKYPVAPGTSIIDVPQPPAPSVTTTTTTQVQP